MFRKSLLCAASLMIVGCGQVEENEFRDGLPSKEMVEVKAPGGSGQRLETESVSGFALGQTSDFYKLTRGATVLVNGGTAALLNLVEEITKHTPTSINGDTAVWGPHTDALSPTTWKLTVTQEAEHKYSYKVEGKAKTADDSAFKVILSGSHTISTDAQGNRQRDFGTGTMKIDWDAAQTLPEHDDNVGTADIRYARPDAQSDATVAADFRNVKDEDRPGTRVNADYRYKATPGAGGEFDFALDKNLDAPEANRPAIEHLTIKSRWGQTGAGRADVKVTKGDMGAGEGTASECWDANFASQYFTLSFPAYSYGEASACGSFSTAVYSSL
jgi:hypothetical protein